MTTPTEFELAVAADFEKRGYITEVRGGVHDWGVDVFATKGSERLAIQAKMYGGARPINRRQVFELYGAAAYFGCTGSVLATDGALAPDAEQAAGQLGITILRLEAQGSPAQRNAGSATSFDFSAVWERSIFPLAGRTLVRGDGSTNTILSVDWSGITRLTSTGRRQRIPIEIFEWAVETVLTVGQVTRDEINARYEGRASSGIALILGEVPEFIVGGRPLTIRKREVGS